MFVEASHVSKHKAMNSKYIYSVGWTRLKGCRIKVVVRWIYMDKQTKKELQIIGSDQPFHESLYFHKLFPCETRNCFFTHLKEWEYIHDYSLPFPSLGKCMLEIRTQLIMSIFLCSTKKVTLSWMKQVSTHMTRCYHTYMYEFESENKGEDKKSTLREDGD